MISHRGAEGLALTREGRLGGASLKLGAETKIFKMCVRGGRNALRTNGVWLGCFPRREHFTRAYARAYKNVAANAARSLCY